MPEPVAVIFDVNVTLFTYLSTLIFSVTSFTSSIASVTDPALLSVSEPSQNLHSVGSAPVKSLPANAETFESIYA